MNVIVIRFPFENFQLGTTCILWGLGDVHRRLALALCREFLINRHPFFQSWQYKQDTGVWFEYETLTRQWLIILNGPA